MRNDKKNKTKKQATTKKKSGTKSRSTANKSASFEVAKMTPLPSELQKLFEKQMAEEYREALFYLQQTVYFEQLGLTGFSKWCKNQYTEELAHATAIMNYLLARGVNAHIPSINVIDKTYHDAEAIFKAMLALEVSSTESINKIHRKSIALNDHGTFSFAQILVKKQINPSSEKYP